MDADDYARVLNGGSGARRMGNAGCKQAIRLRHLSDTHFRGSKSWDVRPALQALTDFVAKTVEAEGTLSWASLGIERNGNEFQLV